MTAFRAYLVIALASLAGYTLVVARNLGWNLLPVFFSNIAQITWPGQFNFDFMTFLGLAGIWIAWRHRFSGVGMALGVVAFFGGMMFLAPYLLLASVQAAGDVRVLLLGKDRVDQLCDAASRPASGTGSAGLSGP